MPPWRRTDRSRSIFRATIPTSGRPTPNYIPKFATELGIDLVTTNSQNDVQKLVANAQAVVSQGVKAIVMAPQDTGAIASTLDRLAAQNIPVVTIDTRPDKGKVFMVVRADNVDMGQKACKAMGDLLGGEGKIIEIIGGLANVNGRDRHEGFSNCIKANYPEHGRSSRSRPNGMRPAPRRACRPP